MFDLVFSACYIGSFDIFNLCLQSLIVSELTMVTTKSPNRILLFLPPDLPFIKVQIPWVILKFVVLRNSDWSSVHLFQTHYHLVSSQSACISKISFVSCCLDTFPVSQRLYAQIAEAICTELQRLYAELQRLYTQIAEAICRLQ